MTGLRAAARIIFAAHQDRLYCPRPATDTMVVLGAKVERAAVAVMRWDYCRDSERIRCELSLDDNRLGYEVRTQRLDGVSSRSVETYREVSKAFRRQSEIEAKLIEDGWTLEHYEKTFPAVS